MPLDKLLENPAFVALWQPKWAVGDWIGNLRLHWREPDDHPVSAEDEKQYMRSVD